MKQVDARPNSVLCGLGQYDLPSGSQRALGAWPSRDRRLHNPLHTEAQVRRVRRFLGTNRR